MKNKLGFTKRIFFIVLIVIIVILTSIYFYERFVFICEKERYIYLSPDKKCPDGYTRDAVPFHNRCYLNTKKCPPSIAQSIRCVLFGCPKAVCLSSNTVISTPSGEINVKELEQGMIVWTLDKYGNKIAMPIEVSSITYVPKKHRMIHLILSDGRGLFVSFGHPTADGRTFEQLKVDDILDGSKIIKIELVTYKDTKTYDILPAGDTGYYWANNILIGSSLASKN